MPAVPPFSIARLVAAIILLYTFVTFAETVIPLSREIPLNSEFIIPPALPERPVRLQPVPPPPRREHNLFTCSDCSPGHRQWYSDIRELKHAAHLCGYDYLEIRITQAFGHDEQRSTLTVYARSLSDNSLKIDSAVSIYHSPKSAKQIRVTYPHTSRTIVLPSRVTTWPGTDHSAAIDAAAAHCRTFSAGCMVRKTGETNPAWFFTMDNVAYRIEEGNLISRPLSAAEEIDGTMDGRVEYRLGTWGTTPLQPGGHRMTHGQPPEILQFSVNDSTTLCRVSVECESSRGLYRCILGSSSHRDTLPLNGDRHRQATISFDASPDDTLLTLEVIDSEGNSALRSLPLFTGRRIIEAEREKHQMVTQVVKEQARGNPLATGAYFLSQFTGNPVSYISRQILRHKAECRIEATRDFSVPESAPLAFPCEGIIYPERLEAREGSYQASFFADDIALRDAFIDSLRNPVLASPDAMPCTYSLSAPLTNGKYPFSWSIDTAPVTGEATNPHSALLVCAEAEYRHETVALHELPRILPAPSKNVRFALCHLLPDTSGDTLTYTCCVRYTDRSADLLHYRMIFSNGTAAPGAPYLNSALSVDDVIVNQQNGEVCFLMPMSIKCRKNIFRVDTFVHSLRENRTTGWGAVSCRG